MKRKHFWLSSTPRMCSVFLCGVGAVKCVDVFVSDPSEVACRCQVMDCDMSLLNQTTFFARVHDGCF